MRWSKLKQLVESRFADSARGRVHVHATRHHRSAECITRGWITVDGEEIFEASTGRARIQEFKRFEPDRFKKSGFEDVDLESEEIAGWDFARQLFDYLNMKPADALSSKSPILQAMAILDSRTGKRTLDKLQDKSFPEFIERLLKVRTEKPGATSA